MGLDDAAPLRERVPRNVRGGPTGPEDRFSVDAPGDLRVLWAHRLLLDGLRRWWGIASLARVVPCTTRFRVFATLQIWGREGDDGGALLVEPGEERDARWYLSRVGDIWVEAGPGYERRLPRGGLEVRSREKREVVADAGGMTYGQAWTFARWWYERDPEEWAPWKVRNAKL